jgi:hypothetical protein
LRISVPTHKGTLGGAGATSIETPVTAPGIPQSKQFGTPTRRVYAVQTCGLKALRGLASLIGAQKSLGLSFGVSLSHRKYCI